MKNTVRYATTFLVAALTAAQLFGAPAETTMPFPGSSGSFEQAMPVTPAQKEAGRLLQQISERAAIAGKHADRLDSYTRVGSRLSYTTHATELNGAKEAINAMGADFRKLQDLRAAALPWQQVLIDRLQPVLAGMAGQATEAIERLNQNQRMLPSPEYRDAVGNLYAYADQARTLVSVNLDYAQAREKLNLLDAAPADPMVKMLMAREAARASAKPAKSLEQRVRSELLELAYYGVFDHLAFQVNGDQVTLMGEVSWPTLKTDAERVVRGVEGVGSVTSEIKVLPLSRSDNSIRLATYRAIYGQPAMARYRLNPNPPIRIIVENGHVTLKGMVGSEMERTIANLQANSVPGAFSVTNHLQVGS